MVFFTVVSKQGVFLPNNKFICGHRSSSDAGQNKQAKIAKKGWSRLAPSQTLQWFVCGMTANTNNYK